MNTRTIRRPAAFLALACAGLAAVATAAPRDHATQNVAHTASSANAAVAAVGEKAPDFTLTDTNGKKHKLSEYTEQDKVVVLEWFNPGCPFVKKHYREDTNTMNKLADKYRSDNVVWLRVNSGAPGKQGAGLEHNRDIAEQWNIKDPILLDESGEVGKKYQATNTPGMYVIDQDGTLVYWGAIDDDRGGRNAGETNYVSLAIDSVLKGEPVATSKTKPYGCGVKYAD